MVVGSAAAVVVVVLLLMGLLIWHPWQSPNNSGTSASTTSAPVLPTVAAPPPFSTIAGPPPAPATSAPPAPDPLYALPACYDGRTLITVEPDTSNLFCRRHFYEDLKWTRWTASGADATGIQQLQNCEPTCAQGEVFRNPVEVHFTGAAAAPPEAKCPAGLRYYTTDRRVPSGTLPTIGYGTMITPT